MVAAHQVGLPLGHARQHDIEDLALVGGVDQDHIDHGTPIANMGVQQSDLDLHVLCDGG